MEDSLSELNQDLLERIFGHFTAAELMWMSVVCKEWRQSICMYTAAKRAALVALVQAPASLPDERLTDLHLVFRWLKRMLLLQDGLTGAPIDRDAALRQGPPDPCDGAIE